MRLVIQRVKHASVTVDGSVVGAIKDGFMVLAGAETGDTAEDVRYCADKLTGLRVFEDENDKMNLSLKDTGGSVLMVSQFTLLGDARHGRRPSFSNAEEPVKAKQLFDDLCGAVAAAGIHVETGTFRAHMEVELLNDGPVTILLDSRKSF